MRGVLGKLMDRAHEDPLRRALQAAARKTSLRKLARTLGIQRATITRVVQGRPVRQGTRSLLRERLGLPAKHDPEGGES